MSNRIIKCADGHIFIDVSDLAHELWKHKSVEIYELDENDVEHLITDDNHFENALSFSRIVIE